jgi:hypothetical protein
MIMVLSYTCPDKELPPRAPHASYLKMDHGSTVWSEQLRPVAKWSSVIVLLRAILQQCLF